MVQGLGLLAFFCFGVAFLWFTQKRRRVRYVVCGYRERIEKLEERKQRATGDTLLAIENQLRFLKHGYQEYLSQKKFFS